jgi:hypothetical protein
MSKVVIIYTEGRREIYADKDIEIEIIDLDGSPTIAAARAKWPRCTEVEKTMKRI